MERRMTMNLTGYSLDDFGPLVPSYRDYFDFTPLFEETILSIVPSIVVSLFAVGRILYLATQPRLLSGKKYQQLKLGAITIFACLQLVLITLWSNHVIAMSWSVILAASLSLMNAAIFCGLSYLEHDRSITPSTILLIYLFFSTIFDAFRLRTLWLYMPSSAISDTFIVSTLAKLIILLLETREKVAYINGPKHQYSPEETSSILNKGVFYWLNNLLWRGARRHLTLDNLYPLSSDLSTQHLANPFIAAWTGTQQRKQSFPILRVTCSVLKWSILTTIPPRILLLLLNSIQPVVLQRILSYLSITSKDDIPSRGRGLIAAYTLVYFGIAVVTGLYNYFHYRAITQLRTGLVSLLTWHGLRIDLQATKDPKNLLTLMSTDVEQVTHGLEIVHEFWANIALIAVATYLLSRQLGIASVVPLIIAIVASALGSLNGKIGNSRQKKWLQASERRVSIISSMLSSMKEIRMRGLSDTLSDKIRAFRAGELKLLGLFRWTLVVMASLAFMPECIAPCATFLVFIIQAHSRGQVFDSTRAFTSLSLLMLLTQPLNQLLQGITSLVQAWTSIGRIERFLKIQEQEDFRDCIFEMQTDDIAPPSPRLNASSRTSIELVERSLPSAHNRYAYNGLAMTITDGCFSWGDSQDVLHDISISIPAGQLTMIIGPVASGKSTLCSAFLGEVRATKGRLDILLPSSNISFCSQTAFLINGTVLENIVGPAALDPAWLERVIYASALQDDIVAMPKKEHTAIGMNGVSLSGGQRHKVALARALYARNPIMILDDILSGLDPGSAEHVFRHAIGPHGLGIEYGMTVIFATHAIQFLSQSNHVVILNAFGHVEAEGIYSELRNRISLLKDLDRNAKAQKKLEILKQNDADSGAPEVPGQTALDQAKEDSARQLGDFKIYHFYFSTAGWVQVSLLFFLGATAATFLTIPAAWLSVWTKAPVHDHHRNDFKYLGVYTVLQLLGLISLAVFAWHSSITIVKSTGNALHDKTLTTVMNAPLSLFTTSDSGSLTNRFSQDMHLVDGELPFGILNVILSGAQIVAQAIMVFISTPFAAIFSPVLLIALYIVQNFYLRTSRQLRFLDLEAKSPLYTHFLEMVTGLSTIRAFGQKEYNLQQAYSLVNVSQKPTFLLYMIQRWLNFVLDMIIAFMAAIVTSLAISRGASSGFAGLALSQVMGLNLSMRYLIYAWTQVETSIGAVSRIKSFGEQTPSEHRPGETSIVDADWPRDGRVEFKHVNATYGKEGYKPALSNIEISVAPGEKLGICGRSGSGKSSSVLALFRMLEMFDGTIEIDGIDIQTIPRNTVRSRLNALPQHPIFLYGSVQHNLDPAGTMNDLDLVRALKRVELWDLFDKLGGLDVDLRVDDMSHGQRQMFSLAVATLRKSKVVVLDEVTSNVDHETDKKMQRIIREEFAGCTIIAIAHRLNTIIDFDRIAVLDHGKLCEIGEPRALLAKESSKFRAMWRDAAGE